MSPFPHSAYILVLAIPNAEGIPEVKGVGVFSEEHPTIIGPGEFLIHSEYKAASFHEAQYYAFEYLNSLKPTHWLRRLLQDRDKRYIKES